MAQALRCDLALHIKCQLAGLARRDRHGTAFDGPVAAQNTRLRGLDREAFFVKFDAPHDVLGLGGSRAVAQVQAIHGEVALQTHMGFVRERHLQRQATGNVALGLGQRQGPRGHAIQGRVVDVMQERGRRAIERQVHAQLGGALGQVGDGHLTLAHANARGVLHIGLDRSHAQRSTIETQGRAGLLQSRPR